MSMYQQKKTVYYYAQGIVILLSFNTISTALRDVNQVTGALSGVRI